MSALRSCDSNCVVGGPDRCMLFARAFHCAPSFGQASSPPANRFTCVGGSGPSLSLIREGGGSAERRDLVTGRGVFPGSPGNRGTRQRLSALHRGVLRPRSVL